MRKAIQTLSLFAAILAAAVMGFVLYLDFTIPDRFYVTDLNSFSMKQYQQIETVLPHGEEIQAGVPGSRSREAELKLLGVIPVKTAWLEEVEEHYVIPCGTPFGLKMLTEGVVVVGLNPIETNTGSAYPADTAGIQKGDVILRVNGQEIHSNNELTACVRKSAGAPMRFTVRRGEEILTLTVTASKSLSDGEYRCGIWVRDSSAGIGTVTFYDPSTGVFGGLGHAVCDVDTGEAMPLSSGEVVPVHITGVQKGEAGEPGALEGSFLSGIPSGSLCLNNETGIYGVLYDNPSREEAVPLLFRQEIREGPAQILTTIQGTEPKLYDVVIEKVDLDGNTPTKNMILRITDPELLAATGGIVQGMSGSPILQNGRLAGAVTHVFVNDPTRGYGIFSENMLGNCERVEKLVESPAA